MSIALKGDVKAVMEKLEALAAFNEGKTVAEVAACFDGLTNEQRERYINLITAEYRQFKGVNV